MRLYRVGRSGSGLDEPPYGGIALTRVTGLSPPEPARLERIVRRREWRILRALSGLREKAAGLLLAVALLALLAAVGAGAWVRWSGRPQRLIAEGRFPEAQAAIEVRAARLGPEAPSVLFLRGRLEAARAEAEAGGNLEVAFALWVRALQRGSAEAGSSLSIRGALAGVPPAAPRGACPGRRRLGGGPPAAGEARQGGATHRPAGVPAGGRAVRRGGRGARGARGTAAESRTVNTGAGGGPPAKLGGGAWHAPWDQGRRRARPRAGEWRVASRRSSSSAASARSRRAGRARPGRRARWAW